MTDLQWTSTMEQQAHSEGWCLSERDDGYWEIQRLDDDPDERFADDDEAYFYVEARARELSDPACTVAIALHGTNGESKR